MIEFVVVLCRVYVFLQLVDDFIGLFELLIDVFGIASELTQSTGHRATGGSRRRRGGLCFANRQKAQSQRGHSLAEKVRAREYDDRPLRFDGKASVRSAKDVTSHCPVPDVGSADRISIEFRGLDMLSAHLEAVAEIDIGHQPVRIPGDLGSQCPVRLTGGLHIGDWHGPVEVSTFPQHAGPREGVSAVRTDGITVRSSDRIELGIKAGPTV